MNKYVKYTWYCGLMSKGTVPVPETVYIEPMKYFVNSFTAQAGTGFWKGESEPVLIITFMAEEGGDEELSDFGLDTISEALRKVGDQEAVLVTREVIEAKLVV